jgi:hypothetical protein
MPIGASILEIGSVLNKTEYELKNQLGKPDKEDTCRIPYLASGTKQMVFLDGKALSWGYSSSDKSDLGVFRATLSVCLLKGVVVEESATRTKIKDGKLASATVSMFDTSIVLRIMEPDPTNSKKLIIPKGKRFAI